MQENITNQDHIIFSSSVDIFLSKHSKSNRVVITILPNKKKQFFLQALTTEIIFLDKQLMLNYDEIIIMSHVHTTSPQF